MSGFENHLYPVKGMGNVGDSRTSILDPGSTNAKCAGGRRDECLPVLFPVDKCREQLVEVTGGAHHRTGHPCFALDGGVVEIDGLLGSVELCKTAEWSRPWLEPRQLGVGHAQRSEDPSTDFFGCWATCDFLYEQSQYGVVAVRVLELGTGIELEISALRHVERFFGQESTARVVDLSRDVGRVFCEVRDATRVLKKVTH